MKLRHAARTLALALLGAAAARACSCAPPMPVNRAVEAATAVFVGKVTRVDMVGEGFQQKKRATFAVEAVHKGADVGQVVQVLTNRHSASCGLAFQAGETWAVYAYERPPQVGGGLGSNLCTRSRKLGQDPESEQERIELGPPTVTYTDEVQETPSLEGLDGGPVLEDKTVPVGDF